MPTFPVFRHNYPITEQFGAEAYCFSLMISAPVADRTAEFESACEEDERDRRDGRAKGYFRNIVAFFHSDYGITVMSRSLAKRFGAKKGYWVLVFVRHPEENEERGLYVKVDEIAEDEEFGDRFFCISASSLKKGFVVPQTNPRSKHVLSLRSLNNKCYDRRSKEYVSTESVS